MLQDTALTDYTAAHADDNKDITITAVAEEQKLLYCNCNLSGNKQLKYLDL